MAEDLKVAVITPQRRVLDTPAEAVVLPAHDGQLGVLRGRAALMCELGIGQLRYTRGGRAHRVFIDGGFAQVLDDKVTVLSTRAVPAEEVTPAMIQETEAVLEQNRGHTPQERAAYERAQRQLRELRDLRLIR
jgi:F-type H+-transporting ATPase subunit epsilon